MIRQSKRPLIVAGGGVFYSEASEALRIFADKTGFPVAFTQAGKGSFAILTRRHSAPSVGPELKQADRIAEKADLVIALGTRLSDFTTASKTQFQANGVRFLGINVSSYDARKHGAEPLIADARRGLEGLLGALSGGTFSGSARMQ